MAEKEKFKFCPLLIGKQEVKAVTYGQGDYTVPVLHPCVGNKCVAYNGGNCMYWQCKCKE